MSLEIKIFKKKSLFNNKQITLEKLNEILDERFVFGLTNKAFIFEECLDMNLKIHSKDFVVYRKNRELGRGFGFSINDNQTEYLIYSNIPTTVSDLDAIYEFVGRLTQHLGVNDLIIDDIEYTFDDLFKAKAKNIEENYIMLRKQLSVPNYLVFGIKNPIFIEEQFRTQVLEYDDFKIEREFSRYLNNKQVHRSQYLYPVFVKGDTDGIKSVYKFYVNQSAIVPIKPELSIKSIISQNVGIEDVDVDGYLIKIIEACEDGSEKELATIDYDQFINNLDEDKKSIFDEAHFLVKPHTYEEIIT